MPPEIPPERKEAGPPPDQVRQALARIIQSPGFAGSGRLPAFLSYLVNQSLDGDTSRLKESVLGVEVFQRDPSYDPRIDPIVRVEARRLRTRLDDYYNSQGQSDPIRISLPKGGYIPVFERNAPTVLPQPSPARRRRPLALVASFIILAAAGAFLYIRRWPTPIQGTTVAVLPFANVGSDPQNEYFSDGLSEEILGRLARVPGLRVVSRSVMAQFRNQALPLEEVAAKVKATVVLEGSVRRQGSLLRVTARLANPADGASLWSQTYERSVKDIFAIQDEIAQSIANALRVTVRGTQTAAPVATQNIEAYNAYLKGRHQVNLSSEDGMRRAIGYFEESLRLEPDYPPALASLSTTYSILGYYEALPPQVAWPNARRAALRAIQLAPNLPDAHAALGHVLALHEWQWSQAEQEFNKAIELDDSSALAHGLYAVSVLMPQARWPEAKAEFRKSLELDPLASFTNFAYAFSLLASGDIDQAVLQYRRTLDLKNLHPDMYWDYGMALGMAGRKEEAAKAMGESRRMNGQNPKELRGLEALFAGDMERARLDAVALLSGRAETREDHMDIARLCAMLGRKEDAVDQLEQAFRARESQIVLLKADPRLRSVHGHPRYHALLRKLSLEP